jgi:hypothetical protein
MGVFDRVRLGLPPGFDFFLKFCPPCPFPVLQNGLWIKRIVNDPALTMLLNTARVGESQHD